MRRIGVLCALLVPVALSLIVITDAFKSTRGETAPTNSLHHTMATFVKSRVAQPYGNLPMSFEPNEGQTDPQMQFLSRGSYHALFLTANEAVMWLRARSSSEGQPVSGGLSGVMDSPQQATEILRLKLVGANQAARVTKLDELPGKVNYFLGRDPRKWQTGIPTYAKVKYVGVYPGVDLVYYGNQGRLEFDFVVAPGGDPRAIKLSVTTDSSHRSTVDPQLSIANNGDLLVKSDGGDLRFHTPIIYQPSESGLGFVQSGIIAPAIAAIDRERQATDVPESKFRVEKAEFIRGRYALVSNHEVGFSLEGYDPTRPLVIDPILVYSTYLGGNAEPGGQPSAIAVDAAGDAYITGSGWTPDLPTTAGALQPACAQTSIGGCALNGFIAKLNPEGSALLYATYLGGGTGQTFMHAVAVDVSGNAYLTGATSATDYPTTPSSYQPKVAPHVFVGSIFVSKLSADGSSLAYSTYFGDNGTGEAIAVDGAGSAYVTGSTASLDFPITPGAFQTSCKNPVTGGCDGNAFVSKFNPQGSGLEYSTYLGGSSTTGDSATGIAVDVAGNAYITGGTTSSDFPVTPGAFQTKFVGGPCQIPPTPTGPVGTYTCSDAFATKLNATGSNLAYSTFLAGSKDDSGAAIAVDSAGNAFVTGSTASPDYPTTPGAFQSNSGNIFVSKLNAAGSALVFSTRLGGSQSDGVTGLALDAMGDAYVTGVAYSTDFPLVNPIQAQNAGGNGDAFLTVFNPSGSKLLFSTYLGGSSDDAATGIGVDAAGNAYITGHTDSVDFPVTADALKRSSQVVCQSGTYPSVGYSAPCGSMFVAKFGLDLAGSDGDFSLSVSPASSTVSAGQTATYTLQISPVGSFNQSVATTCAGAPQGTTCTVSPTSSGMSAIALATATITVSTTARSMTGRYMPPTSGLRIPPLAALWTLGALLVLFCLSLVGPERILLPRNKRIAMLTLGALVMLVGSMACGGSGRKGPPIVDPGTPQGTYTLTITGASGSGSGAVTHDTTVVLTVK